MRMFRFILQTILGFACALLVIGVLARPDMNLNVGLFLIGFFVLIILILGRWWPGDRKSKNEPVSPASKELNLLLSTLPFYKRIGPLSAYPTLLLVVSIVPFYCAWDAYSHPRNSYRKLFKTIYESFGNDGVVVVNIILGLVLVVAAPVVYRRMKSIYKRMGAA